MIFFKKILNQKKINTFLINLTILAADVFHEDIITFLMKRVSTGVMSFTSVCVGEGMMMNGLLGAV